jgi:hypothetical protein
MLRRRRFRDVIERQLELFADDDGDLLDDVAAALDRYHAAERDDAEELYGDYLLAAEAAAERLAELRDTYAGTLAHEDAEEYAGAFTREAAGRWPALRLALEET